jgi:hypothetical protein
MNRLGIAAALCLLAGTTVALAQPAQEQPAQQPTDSASAAPAPVAAAEPEMSAEELARSQERVCRTQQVTGSLTRRSRICMTRAEWADNGRRTAQEVNRISGGAAGGSMCQTDSMGGCN